MPIACNPWLEANQRRGKVSVKQSQALSRCLSSSPLGARCLFFHYFIRSDLPFFSALQPCISLCLPAAEWRWGPGPEEGKSPGQLVWSRTPRKPAAIPILTPLLRWQTFALQLSSEASQQLTPTLLSGNANQSLHSPEMEKKDGREGKDGE